MRTGQAKALKEAGCGQIVDLDTYQRDDVLRLARAGRVFALPFAFLLANPSRKRGMLADFEKALGKIEAKGGAVKDLHTGLRSDDKERRSAFLAVVKDQVRRHLQGAKSASNGKRSPGRQKVEFTPEQLAEAKRIWRDRIDYPHEDDADAELRKIRSTKGEPFTKYRARRLWQSRITPKG